MMAIFRLRMMTVCGHQDMLIELEYLNTIGINPDRQNANFQWLQSDVLLYSPVIKQAPKRLLSGRWYRNRNKHIHQMWSFVSPVLTSKPKPKLFLQEFLWKST